MRCSSEQNRCRISQMVYVHRCLHGFASTDTQRCPLGRYPITQEVVGERTGTIRVSLKCQSHGINICCHSVIGSTRGAGCTDLPMVRFEVMRKTWMSFSQLRVRMLYIQMVFLLPKESGNFKNLLQQKSRFFLRLGFYGHTYPLVHQPSI